MRNHINLFESLGTFTFQVIWKSDVDDGAYRQRRGKSGLDVVSRRREFLWFGPFCLGGYEIDVGYEDSIKGFTVTGGSQYRKTFKSEDEARSYIEQHFARTFQGF